MTRQTDRGIHWLSVVRCILPILSVALLACTEEPSQFRPVQESGAVRSAVEPRSTHGSLSVEGQQASEVNGEMLGNLVYECERFARRTSVAMKVESGDWWVGNVVDSRCLPLAVCSFFPSTIRLGDKCAYLCNHSGEFVRSARVYYNEGALLTARLVQPTIIVARNWRGFAPDTIRVAYQVSDSPHKYEYDRWSQASPGPTNTLTIVETNSPIRLAGDSVDLQRGPEYNCWVGAPDCQWQFVGTDIRVAQVINCELKPAGRVLIRFSVINNEASRVISVERVQDNELMFRRLWTGEPEWSVDGLAPGSYRVSVGTPAAHNLPVSDFCNYVDVAVFETTILAIAN